jgi:O-antigen/teichoic acid export membrane protein
LFSAVIAGICSIVLGLAADLLVAWFYGPDYGEIGLLIRLLLIGSVISGVFGWVRTTSVAAGKPQANLFPSIVTTMVRIFLSVGLVAKFGAVGAALAFDLYVIINIAASYLLVLPKLGWWERPEQPI